MKWLLLALWALFFVVIDTKATVVVEQKVLYDESFCDNQQNMQTLQSAFHFSLDKLNLTYKNDHSEDRCHATILNYPATTGPVATGSWSTGRKGCLAVLVGGKTPALEVEMQLASTEAIVPVQLMGCVKDSSGFRLCRFRFNLMESGIYNVSMRSNDCRVMWYEQDYLWPLDGLGFQYGRYRTLNTPALFQINAIGAAAPATTLPPCTFVHEERLLKGEGNPRWRRTPWLPQAEQRQLAEIWYEDGYYWGNDLCAYKPYTSLDFTQAMYNKRISR